jgi:hypothetical protein
MSNTQKQEIREIHHNIPQIDNLVVSAKITLDLWGRGTGKTNGPIAEKSYENATTMPGSVGAIGCDSYKHLKKSILPECFKTWNKIGVKKGVDYWVGEFPPQRLGIPEAIRPINDDPKNYIFWRNGSVIKLFSYNFQALDNGDSIDWLINDEQKLIKKKRFFETLPCLRGNEEYFGNNPRHQSLLMVTDMPDETNPEASYLFDYYDLVDQELILLIQSIYYQIQKYKEELGLGGATRQRKSFLEKEIVRLQSDLDFHRGNAVYVSEATSIDNLHALGYQYMKNMLRTLPPHKIRTSILNIRPTQVGRGFYPYIDESHHGYTALKEDASLTNYVSDDCRIDDDINYHHPLEICLDYNKSISWIAIGQKIDGIGSLQNVIYVEFPKKLEHLVKKFDDYYKFLVNKTIHYYYDNTATGEDATKTESDTYKAIVIKELTKRGYNVIPLRFPQTTHNSRFESQANIFCETPEAPFIFRYNQENCKAWLRAARLCKLIIRYGKDGKVIYEKSKTDESSNSELKPIEQPHVTEAVDGLLTAWTYTKQVTQISTLDI